MIFFRDSEDDCSFGWVTKNKLEHFAPNFNAHKGGHNNSQSFKRAVGRALLRCPEYLDGSLSVSEDFSECVENLRRLQANSISDDCDSDVIDQPCAVCGSPDDVDSCLLCDNCDLAMHYGCVGLSCVPPGDWSCPWCIKKIVLSSKEVLFIFFPMLLVFDHKKMICCSGSKTVEPTSKSTARQDIYFLFSWIY